MYFLVLNLIAAMLPQAASTSCVAGVTAAQQRDLPKAEALLSACVREPAAPLNAYIALAGVYQSLRDSDGLYRTVAQGLKMYPGEKRFYLTAATHLGRRRQFADAVSLLTKALDRWPEDRELRTLLASSLLGQGSAWLDEGKVSEALSDFERAADLNPNDPEILLNLGRAQHNLARYAAALETFDKISAIDPKVPLLRFHRSLALYALGTFDAAVAAAAAQLEEDAAYAPAYLIRGLSLLELGDDQRALLDLENAARLMPSSGAAQFAYARVLIRLDRLKDAEKRLRSAVELLPQDPGPLNSLVSVLKRLQRSDEARDLAAKAASLATQRRSASPADIHFERTGSGIR